MASSNFRYIYFVRLLIFVTVQSHGLHDVNINKLPNHTRTLWQEYMRHWVVQFNILTNIRDLTNIFAQTPCFYPAVYTLESRSYFSQSPCQSVVAERRFPAVTTWEIQVHKLFMLNITIARAFVYYSTNCDSQESSIVVMDGISCLTMPLYSRLAYF